MERTDRTGFGDIVVIQNEGLGYGVDSVLLAAFAAGETGAKRIRSKARIADIGSGNGIVGFVLCHKLPDATVVGIEKRENAVDRAERAAEINKLSDRISFVLADINDYQCSDRFDAVVSNPPYFRQNAAVPNDADDKFTARHETTANIYDFGRKMSELLVQGGDCWLVHRPDRLVDIFDAMRSSGIEPKEQQMVVPRPGAAANIVLIHGIKGAGRELRLLPEFAVHNEDGSYTDIIERIYERN